MALGLTHTATKDMMKGCFIRLRICTCRGGEGEGGGRERERGKLISIISSESIEIIDKFYVASKSGKDSSKSKKEIEEKFCFNVVSRVEELYSPLVLSSGLEWCC